VADEVGVAAADAGAEGEPPSCGGVSVGDAELAGVAFAAGVDVVADGDGDGVRVGAGEVGLGLEGCPVVEEVPAVAGCGGLTKP